MTYSDYQAHKIGTQCSKKCSKCGNEFKPRMNENFCFNCAMKELDRLREQNERVEKLLSDNPEIMELLDSMTAKQIVDKLKGRETVSFT